MARKGKGLSLEELTIFNENEAFWAGDYFAYMKSVTSPKDYELAQLRRRFQSSFRTLSPDLYAFTFRFSNPSENPPQFPEKLLMELSPTASFPSQPPGLMLRNRDIETQLQRALEAVLRRKCGEVGSFWMAMKWLDNHTQEVFELCVLDIEKSTHFPQESEEEKTTKSESRGEPQVLEPVPIDDMVRTQGSDSTSEPQVVFTLNPAEFPVTIYTLSTQFLLLRGVGSATCADLTIAVNCTRCSQLEEIHLTSTIVNEPFSGQGECKKCHQGMKVTFQPQILHENNKSNLGEMRSQGCSPLRVLYVSYSTACLACSADSVTGPLSLFSKHCSNCTECQAKMTFSVGQVEFRTDSPEVERPGRVKKQRLQIVVGQPLPQNGTCKHYKHSYRWFRFQCCQNVYPCDKCHEEQSAPHEYEKADFMICGYCSTEQKIGSQTVCVKCRTALTESGPGDKRYWEGGKGCRDPTFMSKNDKRKHRK